MIRRKNVLASVLAFLTLAGSTSLCRDVTASDSIQELRNKQQSLQKESESLRKKLDSLSKDVNQKRMYRATILKQLTNLKDSISLEEQKIDLLNAQILEKENSINQIKEKINENIDVLGKRLRYYYEAGDIQIIEILLSVKDFNDLVDKADLFSRLSNSTDGIIKELESDINTIKEEMDAIEENKKEVLDAKSKLEASRAEIDVLLNDNDRAIKELESQSSDTKRLMEKNRTKANEVAKELGVYRGNAETNVGNIRGSMRGRYLFPIASYTRISSYWGDGRNHKGIDIPAPQGTKILAAADGVVVKAVSSPSDRSGWGYHIKIRHGNGFETQYAHCSKVLANVGQQVHAGEVIALVGNTGHSFGNHLHFETWKDGKRYDPMTELR